MRQKGKIALADALVENKEVAPTFTEVDKHAATGFRESTIIVWYYKNINIFYPPIFYTHPHP